MWIPSPHFGTADPQKLKGAFHTTQGADTIQSLGGWFQNPSAMCSSHFGADNYTTTYGAYVSESDTAWTQGNMNGVCESIELCGYAEWSRETWLGPKLLLTQNAARWMRYIHDKYAIPMVWLNDSQAQDSWSKGFAQHVNFGQKGSGHWDCGGGFPTDKVLEWAKAGAPGTTPPEEIAPIEEDDMPYFAVPPRERIGDGDTEADFAPGTAINISLDGFHSTIGMGTDVSALGNTQVRCAGHIGNNQWRAAMLYNDANSNKAVLKFMDGQTLKKFDVVEFTRIDRGQFVLILNVGK
jgi:hypothetical protein